MVSGGLGFDLHGGYTLGPRHALYLFNSSCLTEMTLEVQAGKMTPIRLVSPGSKSNYSSIHD